MIKWIKKPYVIIGIGVGVGVISFAVKVFQRQNKEEIVRADSIDRIVRAINIPKGFVGHVLGKGGAKIKTIRELSKARIHFDDAEEYTVATISGSPECVDKAVELISEVISTRRECVSREIVLEDNVTESVWRDIKYIRQICDLSRAKIQFDIGPERSKQSPVRIIIKGRKEEVDDAVGMIDELVAKAQINSRENNQVHVAGRALPENLPLHSFTQNIHNHPTEKLTPSSSDGFLETFISAVDHPNRFWVQISGSKSVQLDKLATEMTDFYGDKKNRDRCHIVDIKVDDIVAAFFEDDWYRAQVLSISGADDEEKKIRVFYLDFGDCSDLDPTLVTILKPEYLAIPFQAIACSLAGVRPVDDEWTEEVINEFKQMVYCAKWKVIMAKPLDKDNNEKEKQRSVYEVQLFDTCTDQDINIAKELVAKGFACEI